MQLSVIANLILQAQGHIRFIYFLNPIKLIINYFVGQLDIQDVNDTYTQNPDIPRRYLPALISGLAFELANKNPAKVDAARRGELKSIYLEEWQFAKEEDRERASFYIQPKIRGY